jgi:predicted dehydrogenase
MPEANRRILGCFVLAGHYNVNTASFAEGGVFRQNNKAEQSLFAADTVLKGAGMKLDRNLKMAMVGGGPSAFIGEVHRKAARMDGGIELVAGAFDINPRKSKQMGRQLNINPKRAYRTYEEMIERELKLPEGERVDFVSVTVPNNWHFPIARDLLGAGFHVMCEKPMTFNVKEARQLQKLVKKSRKVFGLMHNYTGYPMVKLARDMARQGELGKIRKIVVQYPQGWLATLLEKTGQQQAAWRTDPKQSGGSGCMGDIGTHAENLAEYITGLKIREICADLTIFVKGRKLDDDGNCLVRFNNGAKGILHASQISIGEENNLAIWVYGDGCTAIKEVSSGTRSTRTTCTSRSRTVPCRFGVAAMTTWPSEVLLPAGRPGFPSAILKPSSRHLPTTTATLPTRCGRD